MKNFVKPVIHLYALCWNEEKLIPHFLKHYKDVVDKFFIYDNESTDSSRNIFFNEPNVSIVTIQTDNTIRDDMYFRVKNYEWKKSIGIADIVIIIDMDEFLYSENLEQFLIDFYNSSATIIKPQGFDMISTDFEITKSEYIVDEIKQGTYNSSFDKTIMFKPHDIVDINYSAGAHISRPSGKIVFFDQPSKLLHYKYIGLNYYLDRMKIYGSRNSEYNKNNGFGFQYNLTREEHIDLFNQILSKSNTVI